MEESEFIDVQGKWGKSFVEIPNPVKPGEIARFKLTPELVGNPSPEYWNKANLREAAQMALDALDKLLDKLNADICDNSGIWDEYCDGGNAMQALRAALAQPEQEPWGYISHRSWKMPVFVEAENLEVSGLPFNNPNYTPVYKAPPQREWVGLTDEEMFNLWVKCPAETEDRFAFARAIEQALREKNV